MLSTFGISKALISLSNVSKCHKENSKAKQEIFSHYSLISSIIKMAKDAEVKCINLESLPDISKWNTENVTSMNALFFNCSNLKSLPDISKWNTHKVIDMGCLFYSCSSLTSIPDISKWNTKNVKNMNGIIL